MWQATYSSDPPKMSKINEILDSDARFTSYKIARTTGILGASTHTIWTKNLGKIAQWIPHILANKQKAARVKMGKNY